MMTHRILFQASPRDNITYFDDQYFFLSTFNNMGMEKKDIHLNYSEKNDFAQNARIFKMSIHKAR